MIYRNQNLNQYLFFYVVAKSGSFTKASKILFITQPAISKQIKNLEDFFNTKLFDRIGNRIELTEPGKVLYKNTKKIFSLLDETRNEINDMLNLEKGIIKIHTGFTTGLYIIPEIIKKFKINYPTIDIYFDISRSNSIIQSILDNKIDIGIISCECENENIITKKFIEDELVLIIPNDHKFNSYKVIKPVDMKNETILLSKRGSAERIMIENEFKKKKITLENIIEFSNPVAIKKGIESGLGISIMSKYILEKNESSLINPKKILNMNFKRNFNIIIRKNKYISKAVEEFLKLLAKKI